jgi:dipeptide/tripeptide permease
MLYKKIEFINLTLFISLLITCLSINGSLIIATALSSLGITFNIYVFLLKRKNLSAIIEKEDTAMNEKNAILKDLDEELSRRKKEDNFLRN